LASSAEIINRAKEASPTPNDTRAGGQGSRSTQILGEQPSAVKKKNPDVERNSMNQSKEEDFD